MCSIIIPSRISFELLSRDGHVVVTCTIIRLFYLSYKIFVYKTKKAIYWRKEIHTLPWKEWDHCSYGVPIPESIYGVTFVQRAFSRNGALCLKTKYSMNGKGVHCTLYKILSQCIIICVSFQDKERSHEMERIYKQNIA